MAVCRCAQGAPMTPWEAIVLGLVQGVFMFVPVSSTSHLALTQHWLIERGSQLPPPESPEMILFDLVVHVGTLFSIVVVFRRSLNIFVTRTVRGALAMLRGHSGDRLYLRLAALGALSVAVTGAIGLPLRSAFGTVFAQPLAIAFTLLLTGALLYWTDTVGPRPRGLRQIGPSIAITIGLAQGLALMPGLSRSGLTIAFALFAGLKRRWAAEYSFFLAIPTILAATAVQALTVAAGPDPVGIGWVPLALGFVVAALVGIVALRLVLELLYRARFRYFAYYLWALAAAVAVGSLGDAL
jgi:undecaprenyl-diphosphatase